MIGNFIAMDVLLEIDHMVIKMLSHDILYEHQEDKLEGDLANEGRGYKGRNCLEKVVKAF